VNARSSSCVKRCDERIAFKGGETFDPKTTTNDNIL